jgi:processive 1,2-diacylglycerol beta-glucosyltransferase
MTSGKRVLVLYITERSGHHSAAQSIKRAMELKDPTCTVQCVNAFRYAFPFAERLTHFLYLTVIKRVPHIWEKMYDNPKLVGRSQMVKNWIHTLGIRRIRGLICHFRPDIIICTQAFPCGIVADYKRKTPHHSGLPLIGVLTDFFPHAFWVYDDVDHYIVPTPESRDMLVEKGVPKHKIHILGIPIDPRFSVQQNRNELLANYGFKDGIPVIMIMGGGHGLGPIKDLLYELDLTEREFQIIAVCGLNKKLYDWIRQARFKNRILTFRFTDQIDRLMSMSSLIITKPGGITAAEALAKKLPMIILNPIPGQETRNTDFLTKRGAAIKIEKPGEVLGAIDKMLYPSVLQKGVLSLLENINPLSRSTSSLDIAQFILDL